MKKMNITKTLYIKEETRTYDEWGQTSTMSTKWRNHGDSQEMAKNKMTRALDDMMAYKKT